ncbi:hypothetical protein [Streptomyces sp. NPDC016845]|uniref:hypothetical protein n=1 Tax=Streptomyces sp. NPDC016845 TaxID=3364972 RepID=UPI00378D9787
MRRSNAVRRPSALVAGLVGLLMAGGVPGLTACGSGGPGQDAGAPPRPTGRGELAATVRTIPGTPSPAVRAALPDLALYGERDVIVPGRPAGSLLKATVRRVTDMKADTLYADMYATAHRSAPEPDVVDGSTLAVTVARSGAPGSRLHTYRLPLPDDELDAFRDRNDSSGWPADAFAGPNRPYRPARLAVFARPWPDASAATRPWPLGDPTTGTETPEGTCTILTGTRLTRAERLATEAGPGVVWTYAGRRLQLTLRPLLPHERGCGDLGAGPPL